MRLSEYTDYTLRVLMHCAAKPGERLTIAELAEHHGLSKNHLMKIVNDLARRGLVATTRGRGGGLTLLADPARVTVGDIVRDCETDFRLVECFEAGRNACTLTPSCRLQHLVGDALAAFFAKLDEATLADISEPKLPARSRSATAPRPVAVRLTRRPTPAAAREGRRNGAGTSTDRRPSDPPTL
ncbi:MAG: Rrf2 family transcriptional regulator [Rubrivivax sp.]|nr:Rrf2 family transcriptional regulator [Rubrivivax sp.]